MLISYWHSAIFSIKLDRPLFQYLTVFPLRKLDWQKNHEFRVIMLGLLTSIIKVVSMNLTLDFDYLKFRHCIITRTDFMTSVAKIKWISLEDWTSLEDCTSLSLEDYRMEDYTTEDYTTEDYTSLCLCLEDYTSLED